MSVLTLRLRRCEDRTWRYDYKARRSAGWNQGGGVSLLINVWNGLLDASGLPFKVRRYLAIPRRFWGIPSPWGPCEDQDWAIHVDCGRAITRTYLHEPTLDRLPVDVEWGEPMAYCPEHGFERVCFTSGVLDPDPWYAGEPGQRIFGGFS